MATIHKPIKPKPKPRSTIFTLAICIASIALLCLLSSLISTNGFSFSYPKTPIKGLAKASRPPRALRDKFLYWGSRIDCPGKHCESCEGLGHQESSLRCALEEAMFLNRTFVMPSAMCINPIHNKKGVLRQSNDPSSEAKWAANSCAMDSLYDIDLISETIPVILDDSKAWYQVLSTSMKLGDRGVTHIEGVSRVDLKHNSRYSNLLLLNRTASPLSWYSTL
uniref:Uncharacterized protein LOC8273873 isoform X2 n=1 Tax=Rhizophora mucronata TaxID=61149 RepID=A0A2P2J8I0_RHIMU